MIVMFRFKIILLFLVLFVKHVEFAEIAKGPVNITAKDGETVQLDCDAGKSFVTWFHNSSGTKISEDLLSTDSTKWSRYSIDFTGGPLNRVYKLTITAFTSEDAGFYSCVIETRENEKTVLSIDPPGKMTPPSASVACSTSNKDAEIGDNITVTCQCEGGNPAPVLSLLSNDQVQNGDVKTVTSNQVHTLTKSISLDETLIDVSFRCKLVSAALSEPEYCSIKPLPAVAVVPSQPSVTEEEDLSLSCRARGVQNPSFEWLLDGPSCGTFQLDYPTHSDVINIKDVPLAYDGCNITCVVASVGNVTATVEVVARTLKASVTPYNDNNNNSATSQTSLIPIILIVCGSVGFLIILLVLITFMFKRKGQMNDNSFNQVASFDDDIDMNPYEENHSEHAYKTRRYREENIISRENSDMPTDTEQNNVDCSDVIDQTNNSETYINVPLLETDDEPMADNAASGSLNYVELDLDPTSSTVIHNNTSQTMYSDIVL